MKCPTCKTEVRIAMTGQWNDQALIDSHVVEGRVCPSSWLPPTGA